jgi:hypothetical protein
MVVKIIFQKEHRTVILRAGHRGRVAGGEGKFEEGHNLIYSKMDCFRMVKQRKLSR